jgi:hypothetical protein
VGRPPSLSPPAMLALQRLAGNAAVGRVLQAHQEQGPRSLPAVDTYGTRGGPAAGRGATAPHAGSGSSLLRPASRGRGLAVQRKVGFEAELTVPSLGPPKGQLTYLKKRDRVTGPVKSFLDGGVPYQTDMGGKGQPIRLDSDHTRKITRLDIVDKLRQLGYLKGEPFEPTTKVEFVTEAYDELAPGSNKVFSTLAANLKGQLESALTRARSGQLTQLGLPAKIGYKTGVPVPELQDWLGSDYPALEPLVTKFLTEQIADEIYLQATVGIIPSGIRSFLARAATPGQVTVKPPSQARQQLLDIVQEVVSRVEKSPTFAGDDWVKSLDPTSLEAFMGLLSIVYSYLLGDVLNQTTGGTSSAVKNAVPFLIKSSPYGLIGQAAPHMLKGNPPPSELARKIGQVFKNTNYLQLSYWIEKGQQSAKAEGRLKEPVEARAPKKSLITGDYVDFVEQLLIDTGGAVTVVVGKELPGADPLPAESGGVEVAWESFDQKGIPLEYRWIQNRYTAAELAPALVEIITDVREANQRELSKEQKESVNAALKV